MRYIPEQYLSDFNRSVWQLARQVPAGRVATYGQLAKIIGTPQGLSQDDYHAYASRWVGDAMAACPGDVPWQRIVNAQGEVSKRVDAERQRQLLEAEGLTFYAGKLDLRNCQWHAGAVEDQPAQASLF
ncbi:MAG: MGMT family protein [Pseudomonadales bacterium]